MYSLLSSICKPLFFKKRREKMSFIKTLSNQVGKAANDASGGIMGYGLSLLDEALYGNRRRRKQIEQQQKLTDIGTAQSFALMNAQRQNELQMWKDTNYNAQMEQLRQAGLNPAMIYAQGGGEGVTGSISTSGNQSGRAATDAEQKQAEIAQQGMGLQMAMMKAQIKNINADTEEKQAAAELSQAKSTTENKQRDIFVENLRQEGVAQWLENLRRDIENRGLPADNEMYLERSAVYNTSTAFQNTGAWSQSVTNALANTLADTGSKEAQALLANEKAKIMWEELINHQKDADSRAVQAAAIKLASEWSTGEFTNWKTWVDLGKDAIGIVFDGVKTFNPAAKTIQNIDHMTKNINVKK